MTIIAVGSNHVCSAVEGCVCEVHVHVSIPSTMTPSDFRRRLPPPMDGGKTGVKEGGKARDCARDVSYLSPDS